MTAKSAKDNCSQRFGSIAEIVTAIATVVAVGVAWFQIGDAVDARRAQYYLDLRKTFLTVDKELDNVDREKTYPSTSSCPQWNSLKRYWYFSQTEWEISTIDPYERRSWDSTQLPLVLHSLSYPSYRRAFIDMGETRFKSGRGKEFYDEVSAKYGAQSNGRKLDKADPAFKDPDSCKISSSP